MNQPKQVYEVKISVNALLNDTRKYVFKNIPTVKDILKAVIESDSFYCDYLLTNEIRKLAVDKLEINESVTGWGRTYLINGITVNISMSSVDFFEN